MSATTKPDLKKPAGRAQIADGAKILKDPSAGSKKSIIASADKAVASTTAKIEGASDADRAADKKKKSASAKLSGKKITSTAPDSGVVAAPKKTAQKMAQTNGNKGSYIWVPNRGTQLWRQFGLTGIPADRLAANGKRQQIRWPLGFCALQSGRIAKHLRFECPDPGRRKSWSVGWFWTKLDLCL